MALKLSIEPLSLPLVHPFKIARGERELTTETAIFRVRSGDLEGLGETAPIERYNESLETVRSWYAQHPPAGDDPYRLEELLHEIPPAARCGLDVALHDLIGKDLGRPLYRLLGLDPARSLTTSFTIGISDIPTTLQKVAEVGDHPILKVKLGLGTHAEQIETIETIRSKYPGAIRLDANEGWSAEEAVRILGELARFDIEFCEQPIAAGHPEQLRYVRERSRIPIVTDEDSCVASDLPRLFGCVDGVNVKLVKCGGIRGALEMIHTARALGMKIMLGCMVESGVLTTAAAHLTPLVDWADIDGPFLTAHDPFTGVTYENGKLRLPDTPGLGVHEVAPVA